MILDKKLISNLPKTKLRKNLSSLFSKEENCFIGVENIEGIKLVEKRTPSKDWMNGFNCFMYVFGDSEIQFDYESFYPIVTMTKGYTQVDDPKEGDMVVYLDTELKEQVHVGFYKENNKVLSKWTYGNVYLHDLEKVPESYGDVVMFFRKDCLEKHKY